LRHLSLSHRSFHIPAQADQNAKVLSNGFFRKEKDFNTILIDLFGQLKILSNKRVEVGGKKIDLPT